MKKVKCYVSIFVSIVLLLNTPSYIFAENSGFVGTDGYYTGLIPNSQETEQYMEENVPQIVDVKLNTLAKQRLNNYHNKEHSVFTMLSNYTAVDVGDEFVTNKDEASSDIMSLSINEIEFPDQLDNSARNSFDPPDKPNTFPPINNQFNSNSCLSWSTAYYGLTNNLCLIRNVDAKDQNGNIIKENVMSPKWLYNLVCQHDNKGSETYGTGLTLNRLGCATWQDVGGNTNAVNYLTWHPNAQIWEQALKNKGQLHIGRIYRSDSDVPILPDDTTELSELKTVLLNGYVVTIGVNLSNFVFSDSTPTAQRPSEKVASLIKKGIPNHAVTIVGWDDTIETNFNGVTLKGALKVVNSWGTNWGNKGYFWLAYDAIIGQVHILKLMIDTLIGRD